MVVEVSLSLAERSADCGQHSAECISTRLPCRMIRPPAGLLPRVRGKGARASEIAATSTAPMVSPSSLLLPLLSLSAADALRGGGGAMAGGSLVLKRGAQSQHIQPVTPRSVVVLRGGGAYSAALSLSLSLSLSLA